MTNQTGQTKAARRQGLGGWLAAATLAAACLAPSGASALQNTPNATTATIDCKQSPKCLECGASTDVGIICCNADSCTIINYPPQYVVQPVRPPVRVRPLGLGTGHYFAR